jgi:thioredoxin reductase (NADPH)
MYKLYIKDRLCNLSKLSINIVIFLGILMKYYPLTIIGSGPAGLTAAIYASRAMIKTVLIAGQQPGGQLTITSDVENYPGFDEPISGPKLMQEMQKQAKRYGTEFIENWITEVDFSKKPYRLMLGNNDIITTDSIIIATGASAKWLGLPSEEEYKGYGVSACATCDGFFYRGKKVAVIGGGNTAVEEALFLTNFAQKVYLIHRRSELRAEQILQKRLFDNPKIEFVSNCETQEIIGGGNPKGVTGISLKNTLTHNLFSINLEGVFIAIGHKPGTDLFQGKIDMDTEGYIKVSAGTVNTNIEGIFAAGDVSDKIYRQAVTAAGMGCMAALDAGRYLEKFKRIAI